MIACVLITNLICVNVFSQEKIKSVLLITISYYDSTWSWNPEGVVILPCDPPSLPIEMAENNPLIVFLGDSGILIERHIADPRMFLPEEYNTEYSLLDSTDITFRLPLFKGIKEFQFYYRPEDVEASNPNIHIDLTEYIDQYLANGGESQKAPCQDEPFSVQK